MSTGHFKQMIEYYFPPNPAREVKELFLSKVILDFAVALVMIFEPIYLFRQGFSIVSILTIYAVLYLGFFVLLPFGGRVIERWGFEHSMLFSTPFLILYYLSFFAIGWDWHFVFLAVPALIVQKILYWPSYHSDFASWSKPSEEGREISNMSALISFASALAPLLGGAIIAIGGFPALFILAAVLILISNIPMLTTPEKSGGRPFPYMASIKRMFRKKSRRQALALMGYGEELIALVLWPIFIAMMIPNLLSLGAIVSLAMLVNVTVTLYVGGLVDEGAKVPMLKNGILFSAGSWIIRPLVSGGLGVFLFDSFYRVSKNMINVPLASIIFDDSRRSSSVLSHIIFFEMSLALGKFLAAMIGIVIFLMVPGGWWLVFLLAGGFTALFALMKPKATLE